MTTRTRSARAATRTALAFAATRPLPPAEVCGPAGDGDAVFRPAPDVVAWLRRVFVESVHDSPLYNPAHAHLALANVGVLWANGHASRHGKEILGTAEIPQPQGSAWVRQRQLAQLVDWFGVLPDFLLTFSAPFAAACDDAAWCRLVEHELLHCGQATDAFGAPRFSRETGLPIWAIRAHDFEGFADEVRRYGAETAGARAIVEAAAQAAREPVFPADAIAACCGTCA